MFEYVEKIENADLKNYCTFKIGARGTILFPKTLANLKKVIKDCENSHLSYFILGNGSNLLFPDHDLKSVLISLKKFDKIKILRSTSTGAKVYVEAGTNLFSLHNFCALNALTGLEWSYGIPASFGGLIYMNGGAYGSEIANFVLRVKVLSGGEVRWLRRKDINFQHRKSNIDGIILGAEIKLANGEKNEILKLQKQYLENRKHSQPLDKPSAGSVFKRNKLLPAKIIDEFSLKGSKIGGAEISQKHAGFIVNIGGAKSADVRALISFIKQKTGINFEEEIIILE